VAVRQTSSWGRVALSLEPTWQFKWSSLLAQEQKITQRPGMMNNEYQVVGVASNVGLSGPQPLGHSESSVVASVPAAGRDHLEPGPVALGSNGGHFRPFLGAKARLEYIDGSLIDLLFECCCRFSISGRAPASEMYRPVWLIPLSLEVGRDEEVLQAKARNP
jgi:hypothetical protein